MLGSLVARLLVNTAALIIAAMIIPGIALGNWQSALLAGVVFGVVNALIKPLVSLITCLVQLITLGLFTFVINALMLMLTAWAFERVRPLFPEWDLQFTVDGFFPAALLGALVISIVSTILTRLVK